MGCIGLIAVTFGVLAGFGDHETSLKGYKNLFKSKFKYETIASDSKIESRKESNEV